MHYLYIIYSEKENSYYVGESNDVMERLKKHNNHYYKKAYTKDAEDWQIKLSFQSSTKEDAIYLEKFIKRMKSRKFIEKIILRPEILKDILEKW